MARGDAWESRGGAFVSGVGDEVVSIVSIFSSVFNMTPQNLFFSSDVSLSFHHGKTMSRGKRRSRR